MVVYDDITWLLLTHDIYATIAVISNCKEFYLKMEVERTFVASDVTKAFLC